MILGNKKFLNCIFTVFIIFCSFCPALAIDEMSDTGEKSGENDVIYLDVPQKNLKDVIEDNSCDKESTKQKKKKQNILNLFRENGYQFEKGPVKSQRISFFTHGGVLMTAERDKNFSSKMDTPTNEILWTTKFADNKTKLEITYNLSRTREFNNTFWGKFTNIEVIHDFNEHQTLRVGHTRLANGYEGGISSSQIHFLSRSQIVRHFGNSYSVGVRNQGNYKYFSYDVALSDGSRYLQNVFGGAEVTAFASLKPLAKFNDKYGSLKIGGSIDHGRSHGMDFTVVGGHLMYKYKNFYWENEYQYANNYAGKWYQRGKAHGLYSTVGYFITPKVEILARYDLFQKLNNHNISTEYTVGLNYYITPEAKIMLNYILAKDDKNPAPVHKIFMGADIKVYSLIDKIFENI